MQRLKKLFWTLFVLIIFAGGLWLGFTATRWLKPGGGLHEENTTTVIEQVQTLSDLVTVKYVMEKVIIFDSPPSSTLGQLVQGDNRLLLLAHGVVKAGIDLKRLKPEDVKVSDKKIYLRLPAAQITDAYLDENQTKVIDSQKGFLRDYDKDLETVARQNAVDDIRRAARVNGILNDADERARLELAVFLHEAGFEQISFVGTNSLPESPVPEDMPKN